MTLVSLPTPQQRPDGTWADGEPDKSEVFCNRWSTGLDATSDPDRGLIEAAEVQVRAEDYTDQTKALLDGLEYEVVGVSRDGELARVRLERKIANV